jgi:hypothetical protein
MPEAVWVTFDHEKVGVKNRYTNTLSSFPTATKIEPYDDEVGVNLIRKQIPLILAYACTIHKLQGSTFKELSVSFKGIFAPGQAYVALSRVTSSKGLYITDYDPKTPAIYCDINQVKLLNEMQLLHIDQLPQINIDDISISFHNTQGLIAHIDDVRVNNNHISSDIVCLVETWLLQNYTPQILHLPNFDTPFVKHAQNNDDNTSKHNGGIAVYKRNNLQHATIEVLSSCDLDHAIIRHFNICIVAIYKRPKMLANVFIIELSKILSHIAKCTNVIIIGDFNENVTNKTIKHNICDYLQVNDFEQMIAQPTTEGNTLIDHVYIKGAIKQSSTVFVCPIYYSYHEVIKVIVRHAKHGITT